MPAAFLSFLRANLALESGAISHANTPIIQPTCHQAQYSPSSEATSGFTDDLDNLDIPELSLDILSGDAERCDAISLVADSIAEQRLDAASSLVLHPISVVGLVFSIGVAYHQAPASGPLSPLISATALIATYVLITARLTVPYSRIASTLDVDFLRPDADPVRPSSGYSNDLVLAARAASGDLASVLVLRLEPKLPSAAGITGLPPTGPPSGPKKRSKGSSGNAGPLKGGKGVIRAWTTPRPWRNHGIGLDLLREAVRVTKDRCGKDAEVGFAKEHANSTMVLPELFNGAFRRKERKAAMVLDRVVGEWEMGRKRR